MSEHPHQNATIETAGAPIDSATSAMILLHGRGATAQGILDLARLLPMPDMIYVAPQAAGNSWYPFRFIAPISQNEPYLSSGLAVLDEQVKWLVDNSIPIDRIVIGGFSQGACMASEYVARNPRKYGGLFVFSGGLIGAPGQLPAYNGSLDQMPAFLGCSDRDAHIPLSRVNETEEILKSMGALVTKRIYQGMGHTITADEIKEAGKILEGLG